MNNFAIINFCRNTIFAPGTTDEEKIIWAYTRGFSQRVIKVAFNFGIDKICRVISCFKAMGRIPAPLTRQNYKLTQEIMTYIETVLASSPHTTLAELQANIITRFQTAISISSVFSGCNKLKFYYKPPKWVPKLTAQQTAKRLDFAFTVITLHKKR